jgi:c-di-GMP-binding flagellar brake protein YcgR
LFHAETFAAARLFQWRESSEGAMPGVIKHDRRRSHRFATKVVCSIVSANEIRGNKGRLEDLSLTGAKIVFDKLLHYNQHETVKVCVNLENMNKIHFLLAKIVWIKFDPNSPEPISMGIRFVKP